MTIQNLIICYRNTFMQPDFSYCKIKNVEFSTTMEALICPFLSQVVLPQKGSPYGGLTRCQVTLIQKLS